MTLQAAHKQMLWWSSEARIAKSKKYRKKCRRMYAYFTEIYDDRFSKLTPNTQLCAVARQIGDRE